MADVHSKATRSYNMSRIKGKDTKPEITVRKFLFSKGLRYQLHKKDLPGKPDLVFPKSSKIIFIHGCFWHGHKGCKYYVPPKTRARWWLNKIGGNKKKDTENNLRLRKLGYKVHTVWECELKPAKQLRTLESLLNKIKSK
jgi:DNA mismatch endonuclease (patch repair protein)